MNEEISKNLRKLKMINDLTQPNTAFITFEEEDGFESAKLFKQYQKQVITNQHQLSRI